jgi:hypothetical protein
MALRVVSADGAAGAVQVALRDHAVCKEGRPQRLCHFLAERARGAQAPGGSRRRLATRRYASSGSCARWQAAQTALRWWRVRATRVSDDASHGWSSFRRGLSQSDTRPEGSRFC